MDPTLGLILVGIVLVLSVVVGLLLIVAVHHNDAHHRATRIMKGLAERIESLEKRRH